MNRKTFFDEIRPMFPSGRLNVGQVNRIEAVLNGLEDRNIHLNPAAYILATPHHEADLWNVTEEYASGAAYEGRKDLGNTVKGDGKRFKGRSLVMITGRRNYADWSKRLGIDLVAHPKLASKLEYAVSILIDGMVLGTFTTKKLSDYITDTKKGWFHARQVVNGHDKAQLIAEYAMDYRNALVAANYGTLKAPPDDPGVAAPKKPESALYALLRGLVEFLRELFGKRG